MKKYFIYILLVISYILQTTVCKYISIFGIAPDIILVLTICYSIKSDTVSSAVFGLTAGLLLDVCSGRLIGMNALIMLYMCMGISLMSKKFSRDNIVAVIITTFLSTFIYKTIYAFFCFVIFGSGSALYITFRIILPECIYNTVLSIPVYLLVKKTQEDKYRYF